MWRKSTVACFLIWFHDAANCCGRVETCGDDVAVKKVCVRAPELVCAYRKDQQFIVERMQVLDSENSVAPGQRWTFPDWYERGEIKVEGALPHQVQVYFQGNRGTGVSETLLAQLAVGPHEMRVAAVTLADAYTFEVAFPAWAKQQLTLKQRPCSNGSGVGGTLKLSWHWPIHVRLNPDGSLSDEEDEFKSASETVAVCLTSTGLRWQAQTPIQKAYAKALSSCRLPQALPTTQNFEGNQCAGVMDKFFEELAQIVDFKVLTKSWKAEMDAVEN